MASITLKRTIVLVGLMGAGKTSVGRRLAEMIGAPFFDCDEEIAAAAGMSIPEIFAQFGEAEFRRGETRVLARLVQEASACILSTGGGAFVSEENRALIGASGVSVWLKASPEVLYERIKDKPGRPLLQTADPLATLIELHDARAPLYAKADVTVASGAEDTREDVAKSIIRSLIAFGKETPGRSVFEMERML